MKNHLPSSWFNVASRTAKKDMNGKLIYEENVVILRGVRGEADRRRFLAIRTRTKR